MALDLRRLSKPGFMYRVSARNPYTPCIAQYHLNLIPKIGSRSVDLEIGWS